MDRKVYNIGLFGKERQICEGEEIYYYTIYHDEEVMLMCEKNEKIMKIKVRSYLYYFISRQSLHDFSTVTDFVWVVFEVLLLHSSFIVL